MVLVARVVTLTKGDAGPSRPWLCGPLKSHTVPAFHEGSKRTITEHLLAYRRVQALSPQPRLSGQQLRLDSD